ncbi:MAG: glycosyltransferase family 2 protein [Candidatus Magasanikbacteria bacterium]|nr:glycosyltransferase family 2 protein [Candidatus Magasanikbacteria bacterium]
MKLAVHLVSWNGSKYVPYLFSSLRQQIFRDWELLIVDNNSSDSTVALMQAELVNFPVASRIIKNSTNAGFAGGHNQAIKESSAPYVLMLNQDMYLAPDCLEKLINFLDSNNNVAAVAPRLMRWDFKQMAQPVISNPPAAGEKSLSQLSNSLSGYIDALGLRVFRNRRVVEQYTGEKWEDVRQKGVTLPVFGVSGAFPVYRRSAISAISFSDGTFFDETHFMYKEDVDVAYRLRAAGFKSAVVLDAICYHDRTGAGPRELSDLAAVKNKSTHNQTVRYYSYKNHLAVLYKNEYWQNLLLDLPWILWYEFKKFVYFLIFDRPVLAGLSDLWREKGELKSKRKQIKKMRTVSWREVRRWWN